MSTTEELRRDWIPVEQGLPDKFAQVFVCMKPVPKGPDWYPRSNVALAWQKRGMWFGSFVDPLTGNVENGEFPDDLITHWMPLPDPPLSNVDEAILGVEIYVELDELQTLIDACDIYVFSDKLNDIRSQLQRQYERFKAGSTLKEGM